WRTAMGANINRIKRRITRGNIVSSRKSHSTRSAIDPVRRTFKFYKNSDRSFVQNYQASRIVFFPRKRGSILLISEGRDITQPVQNVCQSAGFGDGDFQFFPALVRPWLRRTFISKR